MARPVTIQMERSTKPTGHATPADIDRTVGRLQSEWVADIRPESPCRLRSAGATDLIQIKAGCYVPVILAEPLAAGF